MPIFDQEQLPGFGARTRLPEGLGRRLALALVALAAAATVLSLAGPSNAQDGTSTQVDPDCLNPEEVPPERRPELDGDCPSNENKAEPPPAGGAAPTKGPSASTGPAPSQPPAGSGSAEPALSPAPTATGAPRKAAGQGEREAHRQTVGGRRPSTGGPGARRRGSRARGREQRGRRTRGHRRATRDGARRRQRGRARSHQRPQAGQRTLDPVPRWARSLLSRPLPDPLPAGKRLDADFARMLGHAAAQHDVGWPLVLAMLRARGRSGGAPASAAEVGALARALSGRGADRDPRRAVTALSEANAFGGDLLAGIVDRTSFGDRVLALAAYHRAVGLEGFVNGLDAVKEKLVARALASPRLEIYPGGAADVRAGRIDVRVLALMLYLVDRHRSVTVSSLQSGHGFLTKSGNVSAHSFGRAVDIAALDGVSITGHQDAGGIAERALWSVLLLPAELRPSQLISLFDLGGPSFAMADHADHIHVGY